MDLKEKVLSNSFDMFLRYGVKSVTMDDIARENGISKKTLYQLVDSKTDLIQEVFKGHIAEEKQTFEKIRNIATDAIDEMLKIGLHVVQTFRKLSPNTIYDLKKYYRNTWEKMEALNQQHIFSIIQENIEAGKKQKVYRKDLNTDIIAKIYVGIASLVVDEMFFPLKKFNRENLFSELIKYHIYGIASEKGLQLLKKHRAIKTK